MASPSPIPVVGPEPGEKAPVIYDNRLGILWMLVSVAGASAMSIAVREISGQIDSRMIVLLRAAITTAAILPALALWPRLRSEMRFSRPWLHVIRGSLIGVSTHLGFYTLAEIPLATATVLFFTGPIFATIIAALFRGETVGPRRWSAVAAGFIGAIIILRPGIDGFHPAMIAALGSSALFAVALVMSREVVQADGAIAAYVSSVVVTVVITLPVAIPVFALPADTWGWFVVLVLVAGGTLRGIADLLAYRHGEASVLAPIAYLRLVALGVAGYVLFSETPDGPTLIGAVIIVFATLYIARREALAQRAAARAER